MYTCVLEYLKIYKMRMNVHKKLLVVLSFFATTSAIAQNNNGEISVQGVVPGTWELTVYDINSGYDFDLSDATEDMNARVGTIHIYTNDNTSAGGHLFIESANAGRLINSSSGPGIAAEHQTYQFDLVDNGLVLNELAIDVTTIPSAYDLVVPAQIDFSSNGGSGTAAEGLFDIQITIPGAGRPQASGVYTDTITFTIMDDN